MEKIPDCNTMRSCLVLVPLACLAGGCSSMVGHPPPPVSSYACEAQQVAGAPTAGSGAHGCHFRLRHPETGKLMVHTPYSLEVFDTSTPAALAAPLASLKGETDAHGRSGYVRAPFPITPDRVRFVERRGDGQHALSPRLISPIDGKALPHARYHASWCGGAAFSAMTDEQGHGVMLSTSDVTCKVDVMFYKRLPP